MDKKNTMLLTVIAVATLLVAVVGATFAYFATATNNAKTTITGSTENAQVGTVALTGNESLTMNLTAEDMAKAHQDNLFYANAGGTATMATEQKLTVGTAKLTGGSSGIVYSCNAVYSVSYDDSEANINWQEGEGILKLYGDSNVTITEADTVTTTGIDLSNLKGQSQTVNVNFKLTGGSTETALLQASLAVKNTDQPQQDRLANHTFTVNLETTSFNCDTVKE